jgi:hypothetical protein
LSIHTEFKEHPLEMSPGSEGNLVLKHWRWYRSTTVVVESGILEVFLARVDQAPRRIESTGLSERRQQAPIPRPGRFAGVSA